MVNPVTWRDVTLEVRGAVEEDRGSQIAPLLCSSFRLSRWLEAARSPAQALPLLNQPGPVPVTELPLSRVKRLRGPGAEGAQPLWLSPGTHYRICGELHFDFLKSPSSWLLLLSLLVFRAAGGGKLWLSHWVSVGFSILFSSPQSLTGVFLPGAALRPGEAQEGS